jgi:glycosidase
MRVIFWLVPDHNAPSSALFAQHPEFYRWDAGHIHSYWADCVSLDYTNPDTWRFMAKVGGEWVRRFDLDGFGVDVPDLLPGHFFRYFKRELLRVKKGDLFMLLETSYNGVEKWGGDARYGFLSAYQMKEIFEGWTPPPKPAQSTIASLVQRLPPHESWEAFGPFGGNWGLTGCLNRYGPELTRCAAVVMATLPFVPEVCVGSEILEQHPEDDPYGFVARVLNLRQKHPSFRSTQVEMVPHDREEQACVYLKTSDSEWALVLINFSAGPVTLTLTLPTEAAAAFHRGPPTDLLTDRPVSWRWLSGQQVECELSARTPMILGVPRGGRG